jgi:hypothetical protein
MMDAPTISATRQVRVGSSASPDARAAGREAAQGALSDDTRLLVVLSSSLLDLDQLCHGIAEVAAGIPTIGCTTAGEIASAGPGDAGVVVMGLGGSGFSIATGMATISNGDIRGAAAQAARCVDEVEAREHTVLLLLSDGLAGDQQEVVRGAFQQVGAAVPLVGGCAGDDLRMGGTHQIYGDRVITGSIVAAAISSDSPIGIGVRHGWLPVGEPMMVTESEGVTVLGLDDRPALDVYLERLDAPPEAYVDHAAFTAFAATRPLGLSRRGREEVRFVAQADFERRSILCFAEVPQGGVASIMSGDAESILQATDDACGDAIATLGGDDPLGLLVFDCIARRGVLGNETIVEEISRIRRHGDGAPVAGFYTYGEIARVEGATGFHNQTLVVLAFG